jgi:hypothetical protein
VTALRRRVSDESGSSLITGVLVIGALMVPVLFLVPLFARVELAHLAAEQTARDAVRSAAQAPDLDRANSAVDLAAARARGDGRAPVRVSLSGEWRRGSVLQATARTTVTIGRLPGLGRFGRVTVQARARAPLDQYRSLAGATP